MQRKPFSKLAVIAGAIALIGLVGLLASGLGTRWGWWHFRTGLTVFRFSAYAGIAAMGLGLAALAAARLGSGARGVPLALLAVLAGAATTAGPLLMMRKAKQVPMIHDISTDMVNPPAFQAVLPLRQDATNPPEYAQDAAAHQARAYPDIQPLQLPVGPQEAHARALAAANQLGWEVVANDPTSGRVEVVDTTPFFGFKDDVVIRITATETGSRVDVRSKSRVGKSDVGKNAERIRTFLTRMKKTN